jgi:hypothetical protein
MFISLYVEAYTNAAAAADEWKYIILIMINGNADAYADVVANVVCWCWWDIYTSYSAIHPFSHSAIHCTNIITFIQTNKQTYYSSIFLTSGEVRIPAEFKHINKRRKRN